MSFTRDKNLDLFILSFLDERDLSNLSITNKYYLELCESDELWISKLSDFKETSEDPSDLLKYKEDHISFKDFYLILSLGFFERISLLVKMRELGILFRQDRPWTKLVDLD